MGHLPGFLGQGILSKAVRLFWRCRRGVTALEFGFVAPLLIITTLGVVELGMMLFVSALLEGGMRQAARFGITGYQPAGVSREVQVRTVLDKNMAGLVSADDITFSQTVYENFNQIGQPEPYDDENGNGSYDSGESFVDVNGNGTWDSDMGIPGVGGPGDVVVYTAVVNWPLFTPVFNRLFGDKGSVTLSASMVVRNEPFDDESGGAGS
jgi:Flp pilus assembly protein TadG